MKNISLKTVILLLFITISCKSQEKNNLTLTEYNNIMVDGVKWDDIYKTGGDISRMKILFGNTLNYKTGSEPNPSIGFWDKGFNFEFEDRSGEGNYSLVYFSVDNAMSLITIKGKTFSIGDDISILGRIAKNTYRDGNKGVIFIVEGSDSSGFSIKFDPITNKITEIEYIEFD